MSVQREAQFNVALSVEEARALFTPEGERRWAGEAWDPHYPDPARLDEPGAVFVTTSGGRQTVWVMVDASSTAIRYVRTTANVDSGIVEVTCEGRGPAETLVTVAYDVTALGPEGEAALADFADDYEAYIASWGSEIKTALG